MIRTILITSIALGIAFPVVADEKKETKAKDLNPGLSKLDAKSVEEALLKGLTSSLPDARYALEADVAEKSDISNLVNESLRSSKASRTLVADLSSSSDLAISTQLIQGMDIDSILNAANLTGTASLLHLTGSILSADGSINSNYMSGLYSFSIEGSSYSADLADQVALTNVATKCSGTAEDCDFFDPGDNVIGPIVNAEEPGKTTGTLIAGGAIQTGLLPPADWAELSTCGGSDLVASIEGYITGQQTGDTSSSCGDPITVGSSCRLTKRVQSGFKTIFYHRKFTCQ